MNIHAQNWASGWSLVTSLGRGKVTYWFCPGRPVSTHLWPYVLENARCATLYAQNTLSTSSNAMTRGMTGPQPALGDSMIGVRSYLWVRGVEVNRT